MAQQIEVVDLTVVRFGPSRTILIFSSDKYCLRVARMISLTIFSPGRLFIFLISHSLVVTMSQNHFLIKISYLDP